MRLLFADLRVLLIGGLTTLCTTSCLPIEVIPSKEVLPTRCTASYQLSIGKNLIVGKSSDEVLRDVGEPNAVREENGHLYYSYFIEPYSAWGFDLKHLRVCHWKEGQDPPTYYVTFDSDMRVQSVLFWMPGGAASQKVSVPAAGGLKLPGTLYRSRVCSTGRKPGLVVLHGWLMDGMTPDTSLGWVPKYFAEQGYIVLVPSMRGWGGGQNDCGLSQPADIARAVEWLGSQPDVNPNRIGLVGFSFGGQVALLAGALIPRVKAIVSYYGPTDLSRLKVSQGSDWNRWGRVSESDLTRRSPVSVAGRIKAPVFLINGDADTTVPLEQSEEMEQAMWKSGGNVQMHIVSGEGHAPSSLIIDAWPATQQFLETNLGKPSCVQDNTP